jgi:hypothetical protein
MAWYFNFCAPTLPNDPTINIHRNVQAGCLAGLLLVYLLIHMYYRICNPSAAKTKQPPPTSSGTLPPRRRQLRRRLREQRPVGAELGAPPR